MKALGNAYMSEKKMSLFIEMALTDLNHHEYVYEHKNSRKHEINKIEFFVKNM